MWAVYNKDTKMIGTMEKGVEFANELVKNCDEFHGSIETTDEDIITNHRHYLVNDTFDGFIYSAERVEYYRLGDISVDLTNLKQIRSELLKKCDWISLPDVSLDNKAEWLEYRQALRDWPTQHTPDVNMWTYAPIPPGKTREDVVLYEGQLSLW
jgi:hypothetical protein